MKLLLFLMGISAAAISLSCSRRVYTSNGETIYKTGRNLQGEKLLNRSASRIKFVNNCQGCHGRNGDRMNSVSIRFKFLSNPESFPVAYTDSLFYRFLDHDLKSDGTKANIGVIWKMSDQDKKTLLEYLKTL